MMDIYKAGVEFFPITKGMNELDISLLKKNFFKEREIDCRNKILKF